MTAQSSLPDLQPASLPETTGSVSSPPRQSKRNWLVFLAGIGIGVFCLCSILLGTWLFLIQRGINEVREMGPWPGLDAKPVELVKIDLSQLGLQPGPIQNARDEETWANGGYQDGVLITYHSGAKTLVSIWALKYGQKEAAGNDYASTRAYVEGGGCGAYATAYFGSAGILHCQFTDAYVKLFWDNYWIINILALDGTDLPAERLVDEVRDALAAHWRDLEQQAP